MNNQQTTLDELWPLMKEVIESEGEFTFIPNGVSMLPLIVPGKDSVTLVKANDIKKYDIVLYKRDNGQFVLHRVVGFHKNEYIMCGDNQFFLERNITKTHILASLKEIIKNGKAVDFSSASYKKYLKTLPLRRFKLKLKYLVGRAKKKILKR